MYFLFLFSLLLIINCNNVEQLLIQSLISNFVIYGKVLMYANIFW